MAARFVKEPTLPNDDAELIKAGAQGIVEGAMKPFSDLIQALFGPAAAEAGLMLEESVRDFRRARRMRFLRQTKRVLSNTNIKPAKVSLKLLIPIIENASNEEEDGLQDIWANLLANAADPLRENRVYPAFPAILKEMTARDVKFLDGLFSTALELGKGARGMFNVEDVKFHPKMLGAVYLRAGLPRHQKPGDPAARRQRIDDLRADARDMRLSMDTFERQGVVVRTYGLTDDKSEVGTLRSFTALGACFVRACRAPKDSQ
jgi:hypothetical protein